jgi:hypothetical protein
MGEFKFVMSYGQEAEIHSNPSSQFVMMGKLPKNRTGKYLPYVFTEHGVTMLASVLKSPIIIGWAERKNRRS